MSELDVPDSVQLIDTDNFSVLKSIVPAVGVGDMDSTNTKLHNFQGSNTLAISENGKLGMIADQDNSLMADFPVMVPDHGILLNLETGETLDVFLSGGVSTGSFTIPGNKGFVIINQENISVWDMTTEKSLRINLFPNDFQPTSRPAFSKDGRKMFLAAPVEDTLLLIDLDRGATARSIELGPSIELESDGVKFTVPAAPTGVAFSPDEKILTAVKFNSSEIDLLTPTFTFFVPELVAENEDTLDVMGEGGDVPIVERFFTGIAVSNSGDENAEVIFSPLASLGRLDLDEVAYAATIEAEPNPIPVAAGTLGQTVLKWNATGTAEEIEVRIGSANGVLFSSFPESIGNQQTGEWVKDGMVFYLLDGSTERVLDTVTVNLIEGSPLIRAVPNPILVCEGTLAETTILWNAEDVLADPGDEIEIRKGSVDGEVFVSGESAGQLETGLSVTDGMIFYLLDKTNGNVLGYSKVTYTDTVDGWNPCPVTQILKPNEQINFTTNSFLQPKEIGDLNGWMDVESNRKDLAGIFLGYDGEMSRLDGGPAFSDTSQEFVFTETRIADGFSTEIIIVNPNVEAALVKFDLFDSSGKFVGKAEDQTIRAKSRQAFPFLGDSSDPDRTGLFDMLSSGDDGVMLVVGSPNPIQVCDGTMGKTLISWYTRGTAETVEIRIGSTDGTLFTSGGASGQLETEEWVTSGMVFLLLNAANGEILDTVTVRHTKVGCDESSLIQASPDPVPVCSGTVGRTRINWNASEVADEVEIRIGSANGEVIFSGEARGSKKTGQWITDGMILYLLDRSSGETLDTLTLTHSEDGCAIPGFTEGYVRAYGAEGFIAYQMYYDADRMAVLAAQDEQEATRFTIPHFAAFGGFDTILKLIQTSSIPQGGVATGEEEEKETLSVSLSLRSDDGSTLKGPVTVLLADGVSFRKSVIDLFTLTNTGGWQSGWIDITSDAPGLIGSAEIQAFEGRALTAVPLQPVGNSKFVFPHVAQGDGFSTGLAVVNSGDQAAQYTVELRKSDSQLVGSIGPATLAPGNRLVGIISELFPSSGEVVGGTLKILSDQPLTGIELFYTDDLQVLSAVPAQAIDPE